MPSTIQPWEVDRVEQVVSANEYTQRVVLNSGEIVSRTMRRTGPGSWRGTEKASVFERRFDREGLEALERLNSDHDVGDWLFDPEWSEEGP